MERTVSSATAKNGTDMTYMFGIYCSNSRNPGSVQGAAWEAAARRRACPLYGMMEKLHL